MKSHHQIVRRRSRAIRVGRVTVGGDAPVSVQTMTNTETEDVDATVAQIHQAVKAGACRMPVWISCGYRCPR